MKFQVFATATAMLLLSTACASQPSVEDLQAQLCTELAGLKTSLNTLQSMGPNSKVGDLKKAQREVKDSVDAVVTTAKALRVARVDELEQAYANLDKGISNISNNDTLGEAAASLQDEISSVGTAYDQVNSGLQCN